MATSTLEIFRPIIKFLPEVKKPLRAPPLNQKLMWTLAVLLLFFVMFHVYPVGVQRIENPQFEFMQIIFASKMGSLITAGIGPIVLASIFLQLFAGAKIINVDMSDPDQKAVFSGTQKLLAILLSFFESAIYVYTGAVPTQGVLGLSLIGTQMIVMLQLAFGSIILLYLDEIVSKYGIGSGISLFIAAGVSLAVVQGTLGLGDQGIINSALKAINDGGSDAIPNALLAFLPLVFTAIVFAGSVYAEGMKVEIPLAFERARGFGGRFPIKFLYVSNIPVILASALMLNVQLWSKMLQNMSLQIGGANIFNTIVTVDAASGRPVGGIVYLFTNSFSNPILLNPGDVAGGYRTYVSLMLTESSKLALPFAGTIMVPEVVHVVIYVAFYVILCVIFGKFWIETTSMDAKSVAEQLQKSGLQVPGYRRDPRIIESVLNRYIPTITILGSAFVGLLAAFADLTGALGTGTGILLTVGILYRFYEQLATDRMFELYPDLKKFMG